MSKKKSSHEPPSKVPQAAMMTSIKSESLKKTGGSNEITLNDDSGKEGLFIKAQKDKIVTVGNDSETSVGNDLMLHVGADRVVKIGKDNDETIGQNENIAIALNQETTIGVNRTTTIGVTDTLSIGLTRMTTTGVAANDMVGALRGSQTGVVQLDVTGLASAEVVGIARLGVVGMADIQFTGLSKIEKVGLNYTLDAGSEIGISAGADISQKSGANHITEAAGEIGIKAGSNLVIEASDITLKCGGNFIRISAAGVIIQGAPIKLNCAGAAAGSLSAADAAAPAAAGGAGAGGSGGSGSASGAASAAKGSKSTLGSLLGELGVPQEYTDIVDTLLTDPMSLKYDDLVKLTPTIESLLGHLPEEMLPPKLKDALGNILRMGRGAVTNDQDAVDKGLEGIKNEAKKEIKQTVKDNTGIDFDDPDTFGGEKTNTANPDGAEPTIDGGKQGDGDSPDSPSNSNGDGDTPDATSNSQTDTNKENDHSTTPPDQAPSSGGGQEYPPPPPYQEMSDFAKSQGFTVTSTNSGKHNVGSSHYENRAIDVRTHDKTDAEVEEFIKNAEARGYKVRDERKRPLGQKEWSGPHLHLEKPKGGSNLT
jgi:hypothetical protein